MSLYVVDIHGDIEGDYEIVKKYEEPRKGHWVKHDTPNSTYYDCSHCGCAAPCTEFADSFLWKLSNFCPDCGCRMENGNNVKADMKEVKK